MYEGKKLVRFLICAFFALACCRGCTVRDSGGATPSARDLVAALGDLQPHVAVANDTLCDLDAAQSFDLPSAEELCLVLPEPASPTSNMWFVESPEEVAVDCMRLAVGRDAHGLPHFYTFFRVSPKKGARLPDSVQCAFTDVRESEVAASDRRAFRIGASGENTASNAFPFPDIHAWRAHYDQLQGQGRNVLVDGMLYEAEGERGLEDSEISIPRSSMEGKGEVVVELPAIGVMWIWPEADVLAAPPIVYDFPPLAPIGTMEQTRGRYPYCFRFVVRADAIDDALVFLFGTERQGDPVHRLTLRFEGDGSDVPQR